MRERGLDPRLTVRDVLMWNRYWDCRFPVIAAPAKAAPAAAAPVRQAPPPRLHRAALLPFKVAAQPRVDAPRPAALAPAARAAPAVEAEVEAPSAPLAPPPPAA